MAKELDVGVDFEGLMSFNVVTLFTFFHRRSSCFRLTCLFKPFFSLNVLSHFSHLKMNLWWLIRCKVFSRVEKKIISHSLHMTINFSCFLKKCFVKVFLVANSIWQISQYIFLCSKQLPNWKRKYVGSVTINCYSAKLKLFSISNIKSLDKFFQKTILDQIVLD